MGLLIDPPNASGHGRMWSHLASDASFDELHVFARELGIPERGFDRDHYDVPAEWYDQIVALGAEPVSSRELLSRLVAAGLRRPKRSSLRRRPAGRELVRPVPLSPGDLVAVVAPSSRTAAGRVEAGAEVLRDWGLRVRIVPEQSDDVSWVAGSAARRAADLQLHWGDPEVAAVWCVRGGVGAHQVLDLLDWQRMRQPDPRWLVGLSDATALHQAFAAELGLATVHGPGVAGLAEVTDPVREAVRALLFEGVGPNLSGSMLVPGDAVEGVLVGGNLTVLAAGVGTTPVQPAAGGIVVLEDIGERPFRLDRCLTQLLRSGWLDGARGVVAGAFTDCGEPAQIRELLTARLAPLGVPVLADAPVGHGPEHLPLLLGTRARLDASAGTLTPVSTTAAGPTGG